MRTEKQTLSAAEIHEGGALNAQPLSLNGIDVFNEVSITRLRESLIRALDIQDVQITIE